MATSSQPRLPGTARAATRSHGRHRRAVDALATQLRHTAGGRGADPYLEAMIVVARGTADALDDLEHDADASKHTYAYVVTTHRAALADLRPTSSAGTAGPNLADAIAAAVRDSAQT